MIYDSIELTPEELQEAISEGKRKKWFHHRSKEYWEREEAKAIEAEEEAKRIAKEKRKLPNRQ